MSISKKQRHIAIAEIIRKNKINNQRDIEELLRKRNIQASQATLSRDLQEMRVRKTQQGNDTFSSYCLEEDLPRTRDFLGPKSYIGTRGYQSIAFSQNLTIIRTKPGYAQPICVDIDNLHSPIIAGTIAGDDTIIVITADGYNRQETLECIAAIVPEATLYRQ